MYVAERLAREERATAISGMQPYFDKLAKGERLSVEDQLAFDARNLEVSAAEKEIRTAEEARKLAESSAASIPAPRAPVDESEARELAFSRYLRTGEVGELRAAADASPPNGQITSTSAAGGYLIPPGWWQRLQVALKAYGGTANYFEQMSTDSGQPLQWATQNPTATVGTLLGEATQVQEADMTFGSATLGAYMYTSGVQLVSFQLANDSAFDLDSFIAARVAESLGRAKAAAAITGTGSSQPLGINTALGATSSTGTAGGSIAQTGGFLTLALGASGGAVKNFGGATTELIANTINPTTALSMIASVDPAYRDLGCAFHANDNQIIGLRGQVDANGRPLLNMQDGLTEGSVGTLFGYPVMTDQNIPNLTASTAGGPIFGHLESAMVCRTVTQSGLLRLTERYADFLQVGFIGYMRFDIRSNDLRAAVVTKAAAS